MREKIQLLMFSNDFYKKTLILLGLFYENDLII